MMNLSSGLVVGLLIIFIAGYGLTTLISRGLKPINAIEHVCHAWLLGCGVVSLLLWCGGFYLSGLALKSMVTTCCLFLGVVGWRSGRARGIQRTWPLPQGRVEWLLLTILVLEIVAAFFVSLGGPLGWDGLFNWETKARFAFLNDGVMPATYYSSNSQLNSHPEYPLFIPWTQLWLYLWMGVAHQFWVKIIFPLYYAVGSILLAIIGSRISGRRWAGGLVAALLFFGPYVANRVGGGLSGYVDFPLGVLYLAAIGYLLLFQRTGDANCLRLSAAAFTLLPWLKREGAILWSVAAFCIVLIIFTQRRRKFYCPLFSRDW